MEFLSVTEQKYFHIAKIKRWIQFEEEVLKRVVEQIPTKIFIDRISDTENYGLMENNRMMGMVVEHFRGIKNMMISTKRVNGSDFYSSNIKYTQMISRGQHAFVPKNKINVHSRKDAIMIFNCCDHYYQVTASKHRQDDNLVNNVYCEKCEKTDSRIKGEFLC